jgi:signal transduction histidine kinase
MRLADDCRVSLAVEQGSGAVWGDSTCLRRVLLIVLDNALRYTALESRVGQGTRVIITLPASNERAAWIERKRFA